MAPPCGVVSLCRQSSALRSDLRQHERVEFLNDMQPPQTSLAYRDMPDHLVGRSGLRRHAGIFHLWALGVGAVISGDFFGWNFGLLSGGFGGLLAALAIMTLLYLCLCLSLAEMSPAMPHAAAPTRLREPLWGRGAATLPDWRRTSNTSSLRRSSWWELADTWWAPSFTHQPPGGRCGGCFSRRCL